jgi:hypothetical protein
MRNVGRLAGFLTLLTLALGAAGCSSVTYNNDFDPTIDFSSLRTYAFLEAADPTQADRGLDDFTEKRVMSAVEDELGNMGYEKARSGAPDFLVNFYLTTQEQLDVTTYSTGWGYYGWYGGTQTSVRQWTEGTLVIDFIDVSEKDLAWRGWAKGELQPNLSADERTRRVNEVVKGILGQYPPKS